MRRINTTITMAMITAAAAAATSGLVGCGGSPDDETMAASIAPEDTDPVGDDGAGGDWDPGAGSGEQGGSAPSEARGCDVEIGGPFADAEYAAIDTSEMVRYAPVPGCRGGFDPASGSLALSLTSERRAIAIGFAEGRVAANGVVCTAADGSEATAANVRAIQIRGTDGHDTVLVDLAGGSFGGQPSDHGGGFRLDLGPGADVLMVRGGPTADALTARELDGTISIAIGEEGALRAAGVEELVVSLGPGDDTFDGAGSALLAASLATHVTICGGAGGDWLRAGNGNDFVGGGSGDDTLVAGPEGDGRDVFAGNEGNDLVTYEARSQAVEISLRADTEDGGTGEQDDVRDCVENLRGGAGDDLLEGSSGPNDIDGGPGNDVLRETVGGDTLRGGAGDDRFEQMEEPVGTRMLGEAGVDRTSYELRTEAVVVTLCCDESGESCLADDGAEDEGDSLAGIEVVSGGWGDDRLEGCEASELLYGNEGDDVLTGRQGDDALFGGPGHDTLRGGAGDDYLVDMLGTNDIDAGEGEGDTCSVNCAVPESCEL